MKKHHLIGTGNSQHVTSWWSAVYPMIRLTSMTPLRCGRFSITELTYVAWTSFACIHKHKQQNCRIFSIVVKKSSPQDFKKFTKILNCWHSVCDLSQFCLWQLHLRGLAYKKVECSKLVLWLAASDGNVINCTSIWRATDKCLLDNISQKNHYRPHRGQVATLCPYRMTSGRQTAPHRTIQSRNDKKHLQLKMFFQT